MTTRRTFLGLLAVGSIVAPVIAKTGAPQLANGGFFSSEMLTGIGLVGEHAESFPLSPSQSRALKLELEAPLHHRGLPDLPDTEAFWEVPNRLFGARINEEGEAI